jgi:hypothetical protein
MENRRMARLLTVKLHLCHPEGMALERHDRRFSLTIREMLRGAEAPLSMTYDEKIQTRVCLVREYRCMKFQPD